MITGGRAQARDDMFTMVKDAIDASAYSALAVIWQEELEDKPVDEPVVAVWVQHLEGAQASLSRGNGVKLFDVIGVVTVEVRAPVKPEGLTTVDELTTIIENAFKGEASENGVWFRDVVGREVPPKDGNARSQVNANFTYKEST